jgi:2-oxoglutarate ferredoxin oxidoreductase subunit beta
MDNVTDTIEQPSAATALTKKDFESDQDVRWCPGCGDYAVIAQIQKLLPTLGIPREDFAFISGIGCSSRFPYYMETYGMHSIHGRAPAIATGLKISRPELSVWVVTGDGDALAIGGNHFIHAMRRNIGLKIILLNNRIYGLTKGQYSPTSEQGKRTKTSPMGSIDRPFSPTSLALGAGATFVARTVDTDLKQMSMVLERAAKHEGTAFVEILQNCVVFNDEAYAALSNKATRADAGIALEHGKPMIFGKERNKGIRIQAMTPEVVTLGEQGVSEADLAVHDEREVHGGLAFFLSQFDAPNFPVPLGVFRDIEAPAYEQLNRQLAESARATKGAGELTRLLNSGEIWTI